MLALLHGYQSTCVLLAAVRLGVFEHLVRSGGSAPQLAEKVGADPVALARLLRCLQSFELVQAEGESWSLTSLGRLMIEGHSLAHPWALLVGEEHLPTWMGLEESIRSGRPAFEKVFGTSAWARREARPGLGQTFNQAMSQVQLAFIQPFLETVELQASRVVDVGGGSGAWLEAILKNDTRLEGALFDLPHVIGEARQRLAYLGDRCRFVEGSFLETAPPPGDLLLLKHCLHNWGDTECVTILEHCAASLEPDGRLLIVENLIGPEASQRILMRDLHMMLMFGGRERTREDYQGLIEAAGLRLQRVVGLGDDALDVLECRP